MEEISKLHVQVAYVCSCIQMHGGTKELKEVENYSNIRVFRQDYVYSNGEPIHDAMRVQNTWTRPNKGRENELCKILGSSRVS